MHDEHPETSADTPITRASIDALPINDLDTWLEAIRTRRLSIVVKLREVREAKKVAYQSDVMAKYARLYQRVHKKLSSIQDDLDTCEDNVNKLRALELELDDDEPSTRGPEA